MKILVTGGFGYIGSHTVLELEADGAEVTVFDKAPPQTALHKKQRFVTGNLLNKADLRQLFAAQKFDGVVHFAAFIEAGESVREPLKYYENNVVGSLNLLEAMREANVSNIVFSSTAAVYGIPKTVPIPETSLIQPINPYGSSKATVERILLDSASGYGLRPFILRYFNACGADPKSRAGENHDPETHLIPLVLQAAAGKRDLKIFGQDYNTPDGTCVRDYVHVTDLARAHVSALKLLLSTPNYKPQTLNLGTGKGFSNLEIIKTVEKVVGKVVPFTFAERRPGDPDQLVADALRSKEVLDWEPSYSDLKTIIETAWAWHNV